MRVVSGTKSLVVCLTEYLSLRNVYILHDRSLGVCFEKRSRIGIVVFQMLFTPTCCLQGKRRSKHEIN